MNHRQTGPSISSFLVLLIVFTAGVTAERSGWIPGRAGSQPETLRDTFKPFWEAWSLVENHFIDRDKVQSPRMMQGALAGMIVSLGDTNHTSYVSKEQLEQLKEGLSGEFEGIGGRIAIVRGRSILARELSRSAAALRWRPRRLVASPTIVQVMPRSPARAVDVRSGDVLLAVDGQPVRRRRLGDIVARVRGKPGTTVRLRLARQGRPSPFDVDVKRARVEVDDVNWQMLPGRVPVAHICMFRFSKSSSEQLHAALEQAKQKGVRGVVLDLRGNTGGLKEQAVATANELLPKDTVVFIQQDAKGTREEIRATGGGLWEDAPLVVLIDGGSASSSEIVAGALQDNERAKLVGTRTVGTGTVLRQYTLSDGSAVLLAVSLWLTPKGRQIWHQGIMPDRELALSPGASVLLPDDQPLTAERFAHSDDVQLLEAHKLLTKEIR